MTFYPILRSTTSSMFSHLAVVIGIVLLLACMCLANLASAHPDCDAAIPKGYVAYKVASGETPIIDGHVLNDPFWLQVDWTDNFIDIRGTEFQTPRFETRAKIRYDSENLYVAAYLQESNLWANQTQDQDVIFYDNDFEIFVDPSGSNAYYREFEMNAANKKWTLFLNKPYMNGGTPTNWLPNVETAVFLDGTPLNDPRYISNYWTLEVKLPLTEYAINSTAQVPPPDGSQWRINFSRVEWNTTVIDGMYQKTSADEQCDNWVWSSQKYVNMHIPERWGFVQFETDFDKIFKLDPNWILRQSLMEVYAAEKRFNSISGYYVSDLSQLDIPSWLRNGSCGVVLSDISVTVNPAGEGWSFDAFASEIVGHRVAHVRDDRYFYFTSS